MLKLLKKNSVPGYRMRECYKLVFEQWKSVWTSDSGHLMLGNLKINRVSERIFHFLKTGFHEYFKPNTIEYLGNKVVLVLFLFSNEK